MNHYKQKRLPDCSCSRGGSAQFCECNGDTVFDVQVKDEDGPWVTEVSFWSESAAADEARKLYRQGVATRVVPREVA